jgi:excisionase family DNA binding protein
LSAIEIERFYRVSEAYKPLGYSNEQGLYRDIREGHFTAYVRIGNKIRIPASALKRWAENQIRENEERAAASAVA